MQKQTKRHVPGVLLLDKPIGITSNAALQIVKRIYNAAKAGHTGSLDPIASGMLPLCFGEATKFSQFLLEADKKYLVVGRLGVATTSGDSEGEVISTRPAQGVTSDAVERVLQKFRGEIMQLPSMFSAIKHQGQPLYKLARQGITIEREPRPVNIYQLDLASFDHDLVKLAVHCSKGTYVRSLVADIGEVLGCGAHVIELRRLTVGPYQEQQMVALPTLEALARQADFNALDKLLLPIESMLHSWPEVQLSADMVFYLMQGQPLLMPKMPASGWVVLKTKTGQFLGVGEIMQDGKVAPRRLVAQRN